MRPISTWDENLKSLQGEQTETFCAMVIAPGRSGVLADLVDQATAHFGHDRLKVRDVTVVATGSDSTVLATADFTTEQPMPGEV